MAMKLINIKILKIGLVVAPLISVNLCTTALAMGNNNDRSLKMYRDSGTIGEKKTIHGEKTYADNTTGITYHTRTHGTFVTPEVIGDIAYFGSDRYDTSLGYSFRLECLDWKYSIVAYWSSADITAERVGFLVSLKSADDNIFIEMKEIDIPVSTPLATLPTEEQTKIEQIKGYLEEPFNGEDRILAAQQSIRWILNNGLNDHKVTNDLIKFTSEQVGTHVFVKTEIDIFSKKENAMNKCAIWALNCAGYRFKNKRRMETWLCQVISHPSTYSNAIAKAYEILETFKFDKGQNIYPDLKN